MSFFEFPHTRTYDSDLGWLIKHVNSYDETIEALNEWISTNTPKIDEMMAFINAMQHESTLPVGVKKAIYDWAQHNLLDIFGSFTTFVFFSLTDDGYFAADIPDSWGNIRFNTTEWDLILAEEPEFGHLVLTY